MKKIIMWLGLVYVLVIVINLTDELIHQGESSFMSPIYFFLWVIGFPIIIIFIRDIFKK